MNQNYCNAIVSTPLQFLNVAEGASYFGLTPRKLLVINSKSPHELYGQLPFSGHWEIGFAEIEMRRSQNCGFFKQICSTYAFTKKSFQISKTLRNCDTLLIGDVNKFVQRQLAIACNVNRNILCDDGLRSVARSNYGIEPLNIFSAKALLMFLLGTRTGKVPRTEVFSAFDSPTKCKNLIVHKNTYEQLRQLKSDTLVKRNGMIWFVGQPLYSQTATSTVNRYVDFLGQIKDQKLTDERVIYCAHPRDSDEALNLIAKTVGWGIAPYRRPLELEILSAKEMPSELIMMYSTVFGTIKHILGNELPMTVVRPPVSLYVPCSKTEIDRTYNFLVNSIEHPHRFWDFSSYVV